VQEWLRGYLESGMAGIPSHKPRVGRKTKIPTWEQKVLDKQLKQEEGFNSYGEIRQWLQEKLGIVSTYKNVHDLVYYRMRCRPKVPRPYSARQDQAQAEDYKKTLREPSHDCVVCRDCVGRNGKSPLLMSIRNKDWSKYQ
jgi:hypothetical protein